MTSVGTAELDPLVGTLLGGRYKLVERLGEGGMGSVYLADHIELERGVAIKLLLPEFARNRAAVERFQREARTASKIGHPNIVDVFDLGRTDEGAPYLAMELLEGRDLEEEMEASDGALSPFRVIEVLTPIANALDVCHGRGVIHRDIKPSNIFIAQRVDGSECPKLVDFGLAMFHATDERLTRTGYLAGTPHYLPPEAAEGALAGPLGDVYSLAAIAYEALCGELPFDAQIPSGVLVKKVVHDAPTMSERTGRAYPDGVEQVLARGLARAPEERTPDATTLLRDLDEAIRRSPEGWGAPPLDRAAKPAPATMDAPLSAKVSAVRPAASRGESDAPPPLPTRVPTARAVVFGALALALLGLFATLWFFLGSSGGEDTATPEAVVEATPEAAEEATPGAAEEAPEGQARETAEVTPAPSESGATPTDSPEDVGRSDAPERPPSQPSASAATVRPTPPTAQPEDVRPTSAERPTAGAERDPSPQDEASAEPTVTAPAPEAETARDPEAAARLVRSAGSLLVRGDIGGALELLGRARAADPRYPPVYRSLGLAYERSHRPDQARAAYERYLRLAPSASDAQRIRQRVDALEP